MSARRHGTGGLAAVVASAAVGAFLAGSPRAWALEGPAPGAVSPNKVKLPDGPASIRGLGDKVSTNLFTAQVGYSVPIDLPSGPAGFGPNLALTYSGDLGNGPVGIGWTLPTIEIRRSTRHGVPAYDDTDELELVGLGGGGNLIPDPDKAGQYWLEGAGLAFRIVRRDAFFEITDSSGTHYFLGQTAEGRVAESNRVAAWLVQWIVNIVGQETRFTYARETGQVYLKTIAWGPTVSGAPAYLATLTNEDRKDVVTSFRTGFGVRTGARLKTIEVKAFGQQVRSYELSYDADPHLSRLHSVTLFGLQGAASGIPPVTFEYAKLEEAVAKPVTGLGGWVLNERGVSLADVDGDGAADLLRLEQGNHGYRRNRNGLFLDERPLSGAGDVDLEAGSLIDLDGDARPELVRIVDDTWRAYRLKGESWSPLGEWPGTRGVPIHDGAWTLADVNGDGRTDAIQGRTGGISIRFNGATGMGPSTSKPAISASDVEVQPGARDVRFLDANGDGLVDAVWLTDAWMKIFLGRGDGTFVPFDRVIYPWRAQALPVEDLQFGDLDCDGLVDLVRVTAAQVQWFRGEANLHFAPVPRMLARPEGASADSVVTIADANGNGSQDVVWSSPRGMWILDLAGATSAGMLTTIDNGLGLVTRFGYASSAALSAEAERSGAPWDFKLPVSIPVPTRVEVDVGGGAPTRVREHSVRDGFWDGKERRFGGFLQGLTRELGASLATTLVSEERYHAGLAEDRELRGKTWWVKHSSGAGYLFNLEKTTWEALALEVPNHQIFSTDVELRVAVKRTHEQFTYEGQSTPIESRVTFQYDNLGRPTEEKSFGFVSVPGDERVVTRQYVVNDDATWVRDRVQAEQVRELDGTLVSEKKTYYGSPGGPVLGAGQIGLGFVRRVDARVQTAPTTNNMCANLATPRDVVQSTIQYDTCGNPTVTYEGGITRTLTYDFCIFPKTETVSPEAGQTLQWEIVWDTALGVPRQLRDPNNDVTVVDYDQIARPTWIKVGGREPHLHYAYAWNDPTLPPRTTTYVFDGQWSALMSTNLPPGAGWRGTTSVFNGAGQTRYSTTPVGDGRTIVSGWKVFDERGQPRLAAEPFYATQLPPASPPGETRFQTFAYDAVSRLVEQTLPNGAVKTSAFGTTPTSVFQVSHQPELSDVRSDLDGLGRIALTTRQLMSGLESVSATYDAAGRIKAMSLQSGVAVHRFEYDTLGRMYFASDPDTGDRHLCYDDRNLLVEHINGAIQPDGETQHVFFEYDGVARLKRRGETSGLDTRTDYLFKYDGSATAFEANGCHVGGRLASVVEPTGVPNVTSDARFCYDVLGRASAVGRTLVTIAGARTGWTKPGLSPSGLLLTELFDDGFETAYQYDGAGRATAVTSGASTLWHASDLDPSGRVNDEQYGNGATGHYEYDTLGLKRRVNLKSTVGGQVRNLFEILVTRTMYGAPKTVDDQDGNADSLNHSATYAYDDAARLTGATLGGANDPDGGQYAFAFGYDGLQNMTFRTVTQGSMLKDIGVLTGAYKYAERGYGPRQLTSVIPGAGQ